MISLIGALLRDFPSRWEYYLKQLQNKQFKRIRKSSSYDYEALDEAMSISVEQLDNDFKDYYKDLSIIPKDVKVPTKVITEMQCGLFLLLLCVYVLVCDPRGPHSTWDILWFLVS